MVPPMASSARNEIAPIAVLATRARPSPRALGGEAQRIVFQRLVGNPLIILAPDAVNPLPPCHVPDQRCRGPLSAKLRTRNLRRYFAVQIYAIPRIVQCTIQVILD